MSATLINVQMTAQAIAPPVEMQVAVLHPSQDAVQLTINAANGTVTLILSQTDAAGLAPELTGAH